MTPLACQKSLFSLPDGLHYLNCAYMSPATKQVEGAGIQGVQRKRVPTMVSSQDFFTESNAIRAAFAGLVGGEAARVAILPSVSYGAATVTKNLSPRPGQTVVVAHDQFPSHVYAWKRLEESGVRVVTVVPPDAPNRGEAWNARLLEAVTQDTLLVALPHVHWSDGTLFDLEAIGERARDVGAALIVDGTQSLGALPFDVRRLRPDALMAAGYKTLMGPYGLGYAHYGPRFDGGDPLEESWLGRKDVEDFSRLTDYSYEYAPGAVRYDVGERCNFILLPMGLAALAHLQEWQPARVQAYCQALMVEATQELRELGYWLEDERWRAHHLFGVRLPAGLSMARVQESLAKHHVALSLRGDALRVSLNVYNDEADVAALVAALREARG